MAAKYYSPDFKLEAVRRLERTGEPLKKVAEELGVNPNTLNGWIRRFRSRPDNNPFPGSGKLSTEDERLRKLERENKDLREEVEILKKATAYFAKNHKQKGSCSSAGRNGVLPNT